MRQVDDRHGGDKQRARVSNLIVARLNTHQVDETVMVLADVEMNVEQLLEHDPIPTSQGAEDVDFTGSADVIITVNDSLVVSVR